LSKIPSGFQKRSGNLPNKNNPPAVSTMLEQLSEDNAILYRVVELLVYETRNAGAVKTVEDISGYIILQ